MPLEHVFWDTKGRGKGMVPISAQEAAQNKEIPRSAKNKNYMCMSCYQYVTLVHDESKKAQPYFFRHSRGEEDKNCPDRTEDSPDYKAFQHGIHAPRIRMDWKSKEEPHFFVGISRRILEAAIHHVWPRKEIGAFRVNIQVNGGTVHPYGDERLRAEGVTELAIGTEPPRTLAIRCESRGSDIPLPWRDGRTDGSAGDFFHAAGALYDWETGVFQPYGEEVHLDGDYALLMPRRYVPSWLRKKEDADTCVRTYRMHGRTLYLHHIHLTARGASIPTELTRYFRTFPYVLTDAPLRLRPLWPIMRRDGNEIHIEKQAKARTVPAVDFALRAWDSAGVQVLLFEGTQKNSKRLEFDGATTDGTTPWGHARVGMYQGLLTILTGRVRALDALYIVTEDRLGAEQVQAEAPAFSVTTKRRGGAPVAPGVTSVLPEKGTIYLSSDYDATVRVYEDGVLVQNEAYTGSDPALPVKVQLGTRVELLLGCDCVFAVTYAKPKPQVKPQAKPQENTLRGFRETVWFAREHDGRGRNVPIDRPLIEAAKRLAGDPLFAAWWKKQLRRGSVPEHLRNAIQKRSLAILYGTDRT